jgi:peptidoglycan/LPS O-acetylase OafA/YrhL
VRTERGRAAVRAAMDAGAVRLHPVGPQALERSQAELHRKRGAIWGRVLTMRAMGVPAPRLEGFSLFENWRRLPLMHQLRSVVGTARRIVTRGYRRPRSASPAGPVAEPEPVRPGVPAPPPRIDELESLRGLAALPVVLFHLPRWNEMLDGRFVRNGYLMVDLFFVLSGFVICTAYAQRLRAPRDLLRFQFLRLGRLWPVHLVFLLVFAGIEGAKYLAQQRLGLASANSTPFGVNDGTAFVENLFLVQALVPDAPLTFNYPAWSISVEVATYLLFGLVALGVAGARARTFVFAGLSAAAFALLAAGTTFGLGPLLHGVAGFFLGAVTAAVVARGDRVVAGAWATAFAAALVALLLWKTSRAWDPLVPLLTAGLVAALVRSRDGLVKRWLRRPAWVALGALSYAVYLSHASVEWALNQAVRVVLRAPQAVTSDGVLTPQLSAGATLVAIAVVFALVLGLSAVVHRTVEAPWRARSRRYAARRWPSGGAAAIASDGAPSAV